MSAPPALWAPVRAEWAAAAEGRQYTVALPAAWRAVLGPSAGGLAAGGTVCVADDAPLPASTINSFTNKKVSVKAMLRHGDAVRAALPEGHAVELALRDFLAWYLRVSDFHAAALRTATLAQVCGMTGLAVDAVTEAAGAAAEAYARTVERWAAQYDPVAAQRRLHPAETPCPAHLPATPAPGDDPGAAAAAGGGAAASAASTPPGALRESWMRGPSPPRPPAEASAAGLGGDVLEAINALAARFEAVEARVGDVERRGGGGGGGGGRGHPHGARSDSDATDYS
eukprot:gene10765-553_t